MFVKLPFSILLPMKKEIKEPLEYDGLNSVIMSKSQSKEKENYSQHFFITIQIITVHHRKNNNMVNSFNDLIDLLILVCLSGLGCIHCQYDRFLASGNLVAPPEIILPCLTQ